MHELTKRESIGLIVCLSLITLAVGSYSLRALRPATPSPIVIHDPASPSATIPANTIKVQVVGAVKRPDVYSLPPGARGEDALKAAGGALPEADPNAVNLAEKLEDGQRLEIPLKGATVKKSEDNEDAPRASQSKRSKAPPSHKININTASQEELETLPGVGEKTAEKILQARKNSGGFHTAQDLMQVQGVSKAKFKKLEAFISAP